MTYRLPHLLTLVTTLWLTACASHGGTMQAASGPAALVQRQLDAYNAHDLQSFAATYSENVVVYRAPATSPSISGKQQLSAFYRDNRFNNPALHAELVHRSVVGNKVIDHERITGLRQEPYDAVVAYVVSDDLIQAVWIFSAD